MAIRLKEDVAYAITDPNGHLCFELIDSQPCFFVRLFISSACRRKLLKARCCSQSTHEFLKLFHTSFVVFIGSREERHDRANIYQDQVAQESPNASKCPASVLRSRLAPRTAPISPLFGRVRKQWLARPPPRIAALLPLKQYRIRMCHFDEPRLSSGDAV